MRGTGLKWFILLNHGTHKDDLQEKDQLLLIASSHVGNGKGITTNCDSDNQNRFRNHPPAAASFMMSTLEECIGKENDYLRL
jgi:hypothetical protein